MEGSASRFTAAEGGARLAGAAATKNLLIVEYSSFIPVRLLYEKAYQIRGLLSEGSSRSVYITLPSRVPVLAYEANILTDLNIASATQYEQNDWTTQLEDNQVLICTSEVIKRILEENELSMANINVLIIDSCHLIYKDDNLKYVMQQYKQCPEADRPIILAMTYPIFSSIKKDKNNDNIKDHENTQILNKEQIEEISNLNKEGLGEQKLNLNTDNKYSNLNKEQLDTETQTLSNEEQNEFSKLELYEKRIDNKKKKVADKEEISIGVYENCDDFNLYEKLEWKIEEMERELCCQMDLAEDIDGGKRMSTSTTKPREIIVEYKPQNDDLNEDYVHLENFMKTTINDVLEFINDHRHDPTEIYGDELYEEFINMPDPTIEPKQLLHQFLYVLEQLGPYAADKAAFSLLSKLEKLKIKVPYERHFLLLCLCTSVFVKIRCHAESVFNKYHNDWEKIKTFCTPKVLRFAEILEKFKPPDGNLDVSVIQDNNIKDTIQKDGISLDSSVSKSQVDVFVSRKECEVDVSSHKSSNLSQLNTSVSQDCNIKPVDVSVIPEDDNKTEVDVSVSQDTKISESVIQDNFNTSKKEITDKMLDAINKCDFVTLSEKIEDKINTLEGNLKDLDIVENKYDKINENIVSQSEKREEKDGPKGIFGFTRRTAHRTRGRTRVQRNITARAYQMQQNPDALCAIVFMKEPLCANIMFMIVVDMSRCNSNLSYLCAQYCATDATADPGTEPKECQRQAKKQEEVLKKFRMHECNLLLATSALEEGIDLPRCNLVLRWDVPPSYRSYGMCRGRARAPRATSALLCSHNYETTDTLLQYVATYKELDQIITRKCGCGIQDEPPPTEEEHADKFTSLVKPYTPSELNIEKFNISSDKTLNDSKNDEKRTLDDDFDEDNGKIGDGDRKNEGNSGKVVKNSSEDGEIAMDINKIEGKGGKNDNFSVEKHKTDNTCNDNVKIEVSSNVVDKICDEVSKIEKNHDGNDYISKETNKSDLCIVSKDNLVKDNIDKNNQRSNLSNNHDINKKIIEQQNIKAKKDNSEQNVNQNLNLILQNTNLSENCVKINTSLSQKECVSEIDSVIKSDVYNVCEKDRKIADDECASVDLSSAIALINRYCGKLPSDTFTRLAPQWWTEEVYLPSAPQGPPAYICTLRLPLNCPVKYNIVGHPMPTRVLARRMVALQACRILHKSGELDNQLMPIGKENFKATELDSYQASYQNELTDINDTARPGTSKRRQYYYKRTACAFTDCQPVIDSTDEQIESADKTERNTDKPTGSKRNMLYAIVSSLCCALPERYNTRGRRLHAPQHAPQALAVLMARYQPTHLQIPAFPVYTRSGEVRVSVEYVPDADVRMSPKRDRLVRRFMQFVFAEVLRVRRRGMRMQTDTTSNNYYIVPTIKTVLENGSTKIDVDWAFLELIYQHTENQKLSETEVPLFWDGEEYEEVKKNEEGVKIMKNPLLEEGKVFTFDVEKYKEAVVTPWYRNQDQPQFFLVAEICWNLSPDSSFPSATHSSFRQYYHSKYGVTLTQEKQPLLDVDHTSARLNLLTPRYVNRKGVALPVSSERTRRAKRSRLDQKQILVPELCRVHPFAAPLWFATVALPCVLYRINALLLADEIRRAVAIDVGLGLAEITDTNFQWPPLDFGWSLAEVLSADSEKSDKKKEDDDSSSEQKEPKDKEDKPKVEEKRQNDKEEVREKTINDILQEKEDEAGFEIGTWSNEMASSIPENEFDEYMEPLPPNLTFCTSASGGTNWCDPIEKPKFSSYNPTKTFSMADSDCSYMSSDLDSDDSDLDYDSDTDTDTSGFCSSKNANAAMGVRIEYKTAHEAEAVDLERNTLVKPAPIADPEELAQDVDIASQMLRTGDAPTQYIEKFHAAVSKHKEEFIKNGHLIPNNDQISEILPETKDSSKPSSETHTISELFPFGSSEIVTVHGKIDIESIERNKRKILNDFKSSLSKDDVKQLHCFSMRDIDIDSKDYVNEKVINVGFDSKEVYKEKCNSVKEFEPYFSEGKKEFDFDYQPKLEGHPGPSPSVILQALTMSNANDGINLERLETIGDSFLKFAITAYLYCAHPTVHEGKLSHMRSKQVSNLNLYRLGRNKRLGARMIASKFEPHDNWLPPCHKPPPTLHHRTGDKDVNPDAQLDAAGCFIPYNLITQHSIPDKSIADCVEALIGAYLLECGPRGALVFMSWLGIRVLPAHTVMLDDTSSYLPSQKPPTPTPRARATSSSGSSSDEEDSQQIYPKKDWSWPGRPVGSLRPYQDEQGRWMQPIFGELKAPPSPLLRYIEDPEGELERMLSGYESLERTLQYRFKDRSLLLQAMTHASHDTNTLTDCYQRLEFLGDAILDYLITRHLYEDPRRHSPGALTDLRSALVNNTIFATLAARHGFHKYFRHMSPGLNEVLTKYVKIQEENGHSISEEHYLIQEDEMEQAEDVEVPKALGDLFESVAGAIFLDSGVKRMKNPLLEEGKVFTFDVEKYKEAYNSIVFIGMSLGAVWKSYARLMLAELEAFSAAAPKSPVRELLEAEPDTAKFGKPERLADGRRVRVCVEVFGRGTFRGVGRNYRIAKGTAARCALRHLRGNNT